MTTNEKKRQQITRNGNKQQWDYVFLNCEDLGSFLKSFTWELGLILGDFETVFS